MNTIDPPAYLNAILKQRPLSHKLTAALGDAFRVTSSRGRLYDHTSSVGNATCTETNNWMTLLQYLTGIVDRQVNGYKSIYLLGLT